MVKNQYFTISECVIYLFSFFNTYLVFYWSIIFHTVKYILKFADLRKYQSFRKRHTVSFKVLALLEECKQRQNVLSRLPGPKQN